MIYNTNTKLILVSPATNGVSERIFSALKRLKTACRSTMSDPRLNNLMTLYINRDILERKETILQPW